MSFLARRMTSRSRRAVQKREDLERQANDELQARISRGRPAPEEWARTRPKPAWILPQPIRSRPLDVQAVRLDVLPQPAASPRRTRRTRVEP